MKIFIYCNECNFDKLEIELKEISDEIIYEHICSKGHKTYTILTSAKFQLLFDMGLDALNKGFKYEAVTCFTNSLERFFEWFIIFISFKNDINYDYIEKTWNYISTQSERQLGAFYFFYLLEFKKPPEPLNSNKVKFRNKVIHKGEVPSKEKVYNYGEYILNYINNTLEELRNSCPEYYKLAIDNHLSIVEKSHSKYCYPGQKFTSLHIPHSIDIYSEDKLSFKEALEHVKNLQNRFKKFTNLNRRDFK